MDELWLYNFTGWACENLLASFCTMGLIYWVFVMVNRCMNYFVLNWVDTMTSDEQSPVMAVGHFDYGLEHGPHKWIVQTTVHQSPINIVDTAVQRSGIRELLTWNHFDDLPISITLKNNGHTVIVRGKYAGNRPTIYGADLLRAFIFVELRFRWSLTNQFGSEHMLNYRKYPLELQAMHRTAGPGCLRSDSDTVMIAYLYEISVENPFLQPIIQNLWRIQRPGTEVEIPPFPLAYLCCQFRANYYSYSGSMTEPPCDRPATWIICPQTLAISERQLNEFRQLLGGDGKVRIRCNSRPVQLPNCSSPRTVQLKVYCPWKGKRSILPGNSNVKRIV